MGFVQCIPRFKGEFYRRNLSEKSLIMAIDVSSKGAHPYSLLSPETFSLDIQIPVPGLEEKISHSVEGIWQGLKFINGKSDHRLFDIIAQKREGEITGYQYGQKVLDEMEARWRIFIPAYKFYLDQFAPQKAIDSLLVFQQQGKKVFVYDSESNDDISNPEPYAHAAALATYLNLKIFNKTVDEKLKRGNYDSIY